MVEWALERGINVVKFFPTNLSGGVLMLKSLAGPNPEMKFVPNGGINNKSLIEYLKLDNVLTCGGSWIFKKELISSGKFEDIYNLLQETIALIKLEFE